jgi:DNA-binding HxlR family transcriptional regulator
MGERSHGDEVLVDCQIRAATDLFKYRWDVLLVAALSQDGPLRRTELLAVAGIADKLLTEALRRLQDNGLVESTRHRTAPPRVDYQLTTLGKSFAAGPLQALADWTLAYGIDLLEAQEAAQARYSRGAVE